MDFIFQDIVIPLIVGILGSLIYSRLDIYIKNRSKSARHRKIHILLAEYDMTKIWGSSFQLLVVGVLREIVFGLLLLSLLVTAIGINVVSPIVVLGVGGRSIVLAVIGFMGASVYRVFKETQARITNALFFDDFKAKTLAKLIKLGGNPEDLDKEKTEEVEPAKVEQKSRKAKAGG
jgi:hypothetical protein